MFKKTQCTTEVVQVCVQLCVQLCVQVCVQLCVCARTGPGLASLPCNALPPAAPPKLNAIIRILERSFENCNVWYCEEAELIRLVKRKDVQRKNSWRLHEIESHYAGTRE